MPIARAPAAAFAPATTSSCTGAATRSCTVVSNPAATSRFAMGLPMLPRPMKPARSVMRHSLPHLHCGQDVNDGIRRGQGRCMARPLEYDPYAYEVHEDPYPLYRRLRDEAPLYKSEAFEFWALSRHRDVLEALKDFETFSNRNGVSLDRDAFHADAETTMSFLAMDPPRHTRMRGLVSRGFTPRRVTDLEPRIRELATHYLDECAERGACDFIADFAGRLPMDVISELLGVHRSDRAMLRGWADAVVHREEGVVGVPPAAANAALRLLQYFQAHVAERKTRPRDDLTEALLEAEVGGDKLSEREILGFLFLMVIAGNETTTKLLANALYWLWRNPRQRDRLREDPTLVPRWVAETARYDNSSQAVARVLAREDRK